MKFKKMNGVFLTTVVVGRDSKKLWDKQGVCAALVNKEMYRRVARYAAMFDEVAQNLQDGDEKNAACE